MKISKQVKAALKGAAVAVLFVIVVGLAFELGYVLNSLLVKAVGETAAWCIFILLCFAMVGGLCGYNDLLVLENTKRTRRK